MVNCDYLIVGAGIIGLTLAYKLNLKFPDAKIILLEKESQLGLHSSGRNSGVLHSGIYYPEESLKARFCADGAKQMKQFCEENKVPCEAIGKVIIPKVAEDIDYLDVLCERGKNNGAEVELINGCELAKIEPEANAQFDTALYSPNTSVVNPKKVLEELSAKLSSNGVMIFCNSEVQVVDPDKSTVESVGGNKYKYGFLFNTSGFSVDKVAYPFGLVNDYEMLPFKGNYYKLSKACELKFNGLIYPVPDLNVPFLGIHSVKDIQGNIYFGPSAVPAFGRLNYQGLNGFSFSESFKSLSIISRQYLKNIQGFRAYAHNEALQFFKSEFIKAAQVLAPNLRTYDLEKCDKVGIRTQLFNKKEQRLEMDFIIKSTENTMHVLNTVSPGFTSSFAVADYLIKNLPKAFKI